jgi:hypothetical protein
MFERHEKQILRFAQNDKKLALGNDAKHYQVRAAKRAVEESRS